jgi:hypothetical protein
MLGAASMRLMPRLEIDFSSHGAIFLPGVSICVALFGIEEQFL